MLIYSDIAIALRVTAATTTLLNGEQTHYDYLVLTTRGLNSDKTKVYFESGRVHVLLDPHTYTSKPSKLTHCSPWISPPRGLSPNNKALKQPSYWLLQVIRLK